MTRSFAIGAGPTLAELGPALLRQPGAAASLVRSVRDLSVTAVTRELWLVVACDSVGAIGPKELDAYGTSAEVAGYFAARVPLVEVVASGATPFLIVDTLSVERHPTGDAIIRAIRAIASEAGMHGAAVVTGSTEDNVPTRQTGIGITVLAVVSPDAFRPATALAGDLLAVAGLPLSAPDHEVRRGDERILPLDALQRLLAIDGVHDVLPVGSRGIAAEAHDLATSAGLDLELEADAPVDLGHSAGPATCVVFSADDAAWPAISHALGRTPLARVGRIVARG